MELVKNVAKIARLAILFTTALLALPTPSSTLGPTNVWIVRITLARKGTTWTTPLRF